MVAAHDSLDLDLETDPDGSASGGWLLFAAVFRRDMALALRGGGAFLNAVIFFALFIGLGAFAVGPRPDLQAQIAPAMVWLGATLAAQLATADLFERDLEDGSLDALVAEGASLTPVVLAKAAALWVSAVGPVILASPLMGLMFGLPLEALLPSALALVVGTPGLVLACAIGAALKAGARAGSFLMLVLSGPLLIPVLIFGVGANAEIVRSGALWSPDMRLLLALTLGFIIIMPGFGALALRQSVD
ncbi:MAG: heme exporter protein CcmB [Alphaproteobacteria bacterium]